MRRLRLAGAKVFQVIELRADSGAFCIERLHRFTHCIPQALWSGLGPEIDDHLTARERRLEPQA